MIMHRLSQQMSEVNNDLVFAEVPLLFEGNYQSYFSDVIVVVRGQQERIGEEQGIHVLENVKDINRLKENLKMLIKSLKN